MREGHGVIVLEPGESPDVDAIVEAVKSRGVGTVVVVENVRPELGLLPLEPFTFLPDVNPFLDTDYIGTLLSLDVSLDDTRRERNRRKRRHRKQRAK